MNYFDIKYFHILMTILFLYNLIVSIYNPKNIFFKISMGLNTAILLISGFMLLGRFGISMTGPYPTWIWAKFITWLLLTILPPVLIKRTPNLIKKISFLFIILILIAAFMGVYKP